MKKVIIVTFLLLFLTGCLFNVQVYDSKTVKNFEDLKKVYEEDVARAREGKLSDIVYDARLELFDSAIFREKAKEDRTNELD